jgi:Protein of unknown function (DUF3352)
MVAMQEPTSSGLIPFRPKSRPRPWWLVAAPIAILATAAGSYWAMSPRSSQLSGMNLLPANTTVAAQVAIDRSDWLRLRQVGTSASREIVERELSKWSQETFGSSTLPTDLQSWMGREIYLARLASGDNLALLPIRTTAPVPSGSQRQYRGVTVWQTEQGARAIVTTKNEKFLAIGSGAAIEQVIQTQQLGQSLANLPDYAQAVKTLANIDAIAQVYVNLPATLGSKNSTKITSQAMFVKITAQNEVLLGKGVVWGSRQSSASKQSPEFAQMLPDSAMLLISGSNLGQLWQEYLPLATNNLQAPMQPQVLQENLKSATGLDLNADILKWGSGEFGLALIPQTLSAQAQLDSGSVGGSVVLLSRSTDPEATNRTMASLDKTMVDRYQFKVDQIKLQDAAIVRWSSALGSECCPWLATKPSGFFGFGGNGG